MTFTDVDAIQIVGLELHHLISVQLSAEFMRRPVSEGSAQELIYDARVYASRLVNACVLGCCLASRNCASLASE